jgi:hypothetical protein
MRAHFLFFKYWCHLFRNEESAMQKKCAIKKPEALLEIHKEII